MSFSGSFAALWITSISIHSLSWRTVLDSCCFELKVMQVKLGLSQVVALELPSTTVLSRRFQAWSPSTLRQVLVS
ncbi:hypothetical protein RvY_12055 [Ramazzottius varieornatus]|uniref:Secreted protein n=1 Tax=Ramazzottius varieornatus TaxID=947166 RepID=A0A1D1VI80_RAMVA|nr:hypothetical protein RvY_12055 [Ramazzottius varieornatus]